MKGHINIKKAPIILFIILLCNGNAYSQTDTTWNHKKCAVVLTYDDGKWVPGRRMNGDQDHQGRHIRIPVGDWVIQKVKLYQYK